jgi:hypothetical protein
MFIAIFHYRFNFQFKMKQGIKLNLFPQLDAETERDFAIWDNQFVGFLLDHPSFNDFRVKAQLSV